MEEAFKEAGKMLSPQGLSPLSAPLGPFTPALTKVHLRTATGPFGATVLGLRGIHACGAEPPLRPPRAIAYWPCAAPRFTTPRQSASYRNQKN